MAPILGMGSRPLVLLDPEGVWIPGAKRFDGLQAWTTVFAISRPMRHVRMAEGGRYDAQHGFSCVAVHPFKADTLN